jgi:hypothetical integral membrane protein (TIGR02206 family)
VRPFERFGLEHWLALALIAATAVGLVRLLRREPRSAAVDNVVRLGLAAFLFVGLLIALIDALPLRGLDWIDILPLHFCDFAVLVAIMALATKRKAVCELLYFWGLSGTVIAMLMPDVDRGFPDSRCASFFALHGVVAISAAVVAFGMGVRPRPGANWRVFWFTNVYAAVIALIDWTAGENFLYLRAKPSQPSILDVMGPWPWYILTADALAWLIFRALMIPFQTRPGPGSEPRGDRTGA